MRQRVRVCFQKTGDLRFLGHRDLARTFERLFRRIGCELSMSEGFHPKPKFSFPLALATGIQGDQEIMEVVFSEQIEAADLLHRLNTESPAGLSFTSVKLLKPNTPKLQAEYVEYRIVLPSDRHLQTQSKIDRLLSQPRYEITRKGLKRPIDILTDLEALEIKHNELCFQQRVTRKAGFQPRELLEILELSDLESHGLHLRRSSIAWKTTHPSAAQ